MQSIAVRLLGPVQIVHDNVITSQFRSRRALALLAYLIMAGRPVARGELVAAIWPDKGEVQGQANLRWALRYLGTLLPGCWAVNRSVVSFQLGPGASVDLLSLHQALADGDVETLNRLLLRYPGEFLAGYFFDTAPELELWLVAERETWRQEMERAYSALIAHHNVHEQPERALHFAKQLLALDPLHEAGHRWLMKLQEQQGNHWAVLAQHERYTRLLHAEVGNPAPVLHKAPLPRMRPAQGDLSPPPTVLSFSPDGTLLASGGDGTIWLWESHTGRVVHTLVGHTGQVRTITWSHDGTMLASGSSDETIRVWDILTGACVAVMHPGE